MTARKTTFLGVRVATFCLTWDGCVVLESSPAGEVVRTLRDFSDSAPDACLAALRAAVAAEGWSPEAVA